MKIEKQELENHQVKIIAEFEADTLEGFKRRSARKIAREFKIPGFRPGKAPYEVIRRNFGDEAIEKQAIELMLDDVYPKVLDEAQIKPAGPGALDKIANEDPPVFEFVIPLMPEIELGDYKSIRLPYELELITEDDIQEVFENLKQGYATAVPVERASINGDLVSIKIKGTVVNPEKEEDSEIVKEMPYQVLVGEEKEGNNWPFEGFSKELIGVMKDDKKTLKHAYEEGTTFTRFANKEIEFDFVVESVKEMEYPELNDEFAQSLGDYETMEVLHESIRENLEKSKQEEYDKDYVSKIVDQVVEQSKIKYAPITLEEEIENVIQSVKQDLGNQNLDLETYLKFKDLDRETFIEEEIKPVAIQRLERSLVLDEAARVEGVEITEEELQAGVTQTMAQLFNTPGFEKPRSDQDLRKLTNAVSFDTASRILNQKILDRMKVIAKGEAEAEKESEIEESDDLSENNEVVEAQKELEIEDSGDLSEKNEVEEVNKSAEVEISSEKISENGDSKDTPDSSTEETKPKPKKKKKTEKVEKPADTE